MLKDIAQTIGAINVLALIGASAQSSAPLLAQPLEIYLYIASGEFYLAAAALAAFATSKVIKNAKS